MSRSWLCVHYGTLATHQLDFIMRLTASETLSCFTNRSSRILLAHSRSMVCQNQKPTEPQLIDPAKINCLVTSKKRDVETLWRDFFTNTSQWWDHRAEKINPRFPDFKHKRTGEALWLADPGDPNGVQAELAAIPPGTLKSNFAWARHLKRHVKAGQYRRTIQVFHQMEQEGICPDARTVVTWLLHNKKVMISFRSEAPLHIK